MITFHGVTKDYDGHIALNHLDLTIEDGQIVGLIGHNGAGKSTTIKSLVSVITPTTGSIEVDGQDLYSHRLAIKKKIGYVADSPDLFLRLTANEFWELVATSYDMSQKDCDQRLEELLTIFDFQSHRYEVIESFSHGMRQKVFVIAALLSDPDGRTDDRFGPTGFLRFKTNDAPTRGSRQDGHFLYSRLRSGRTTL